MQRHATAQTLDQVELLDAFQRAFGGSEDEVKYVDFELANRPTSSFAAPSSVARASSNTLPT